MPIDLGATLKKLGRKIRKKGLRDIAGIKCYTYSKLGYIARNYHANIIRVLRR
jgi:hypothetical protein